LQGRTPNPCVRCNQFVKFASFWERARELGARWVATGHYARVRRDPHSRRTELWTAIDRAKDQSYFLFAIQPAVLERTLFPLGEYTKTEIRARARSLGLPVADKPDSQEVCFAPAGTSAAFVARWAGAAAQRPGAIVDDAGRVLGQHDGIHHFTVGQRRGLGLSALRPLYVLAVLPTSRTVVVGGGERLESPGLVAREVNWLSIDPPAEPLRAAVKIRYRAAEAPATLRPRPDGAVEVRFDAPQRAVTPGQAAVFYDGETVIGGGWIE